MEITTEYIISFVLENMNNTQYNATQKRISIPRIKENIEKLVNEETPPAIQVKDNLLINGHHRYVAGLIFGRLPDSMEWIAPNCIQVIQWTHIELDDNYW